MDLYRSLFETSKRLLAEERGERTAEALLGHVLAATAAERGFVVVRDGGSFEQKAHVRFERGAVSAEERRFSRSLVRRVLESGEPLESPDLAADPRFAGLESVRLLGRSAVLVVPLGHAGKVWGVLYLVRGAGAFSAEARRFAAEFAGMAGLCLRKAVEQERLRERARSLERGLDSRQRFPGIVTEHPRMLELLRTVTQVAGTEAAVLITGETGTGKELVAQALHLNSARAAKPFVTLHCAALSGTVLESELFGHVRGAFTGAERERKGRLASADGGTLLLDEVGEIAPEVQAKLLRFLQSGEIQRVGSDQTETLDVRVLAATLEDLPALVAARKFRQDLYFRLKVVELHVPPLRERASDVPLLLAHFLGQAWKRPGEAPRFGAEAEAALLAHGWPGNVRELEHVVHRACALARGPVLDMEVLPPELRRAAAAPARPRFATLDNAGLKAAKKAAQQEVERAFVEELLARHGRNVSRAARAAGMQRGNLQKLLARHRGGASSGAVQGAGQESLTKPGVRGTTSPGGSGQSPASVRDS